MVLGSTFMSRFEEYCPQWLAEEKDPVGLQIGTLDKEVKRVMMTLDVRPEVVAEAIAKKIDLVIAKHPPIFRPVHTLTTEDPQTKMYIDLIQHDIAVYTAHTNMDIIHDGLNDWFCEDLSIQETTYLKATHTLPMAVFTIIDAPERFATQLTMRFKDLAGGIEILDTKPLKFAVLEKQVAVIQQWCDRQGVLATSEKSPQTQTFGIGRVGTLTTPKSLDAFAADVKQAFHLDGLRVVPANDQMIRTVAICGGSGGSLYPNALEKQADVYITGDLYYHTAHDLQALGLAAIDPGHHIEERCILTFVQKMIEWSQVDGFAVDVVASTVNTNPFYFK